MKLVYLHGHGASNDSFNYIRSQVTGYDEICISYDSSSGFATNKKAMVSRLAGEGEIFIIAHSLGGLYALHLADALSEQVIGAVTMATPYGGSESALALNFFMPAQIYKDIHPAAFPITSGKEIILHGKMWTAIISTKGHSQLMMAANDGIVTLDSMRARNGARFIEVPSNHHEVVQSRQSVEIIKNAIKEAE